jgi:hypothetical protein
MKQINEVKRMQQLAGILKEDRHEIWNGQPEPISDNLYNELKSFSSKEKKINEKLEGIKLPNSSEFIEIDFESEEFFYRTQDLDSVTHKRITTSESFDFGKGEKIYEGEKQLIIALIDKIKRL